MNIHTHWTKIFYPALLVCALCIGCGDDGGPSASPTTAPDAGEQSDTEEHDTAIDANDSDVGTDTHDDTDVDSPNAEEPNAEVIVCVEVDNGCLGRTALDFGEVPVGTSQTQWVRVRNIGSVDLSIPEVETGWDYFQVAQEDQASPAVLRPNETLRVRFELLAGAAPGGFEVREINLNLGSDLGDVPVSFQIEGTIAGCENPQASCDGSWENGCETNTHTDLQHCGACGSPCEGECVDGLCGCPSGFTGDDCDEDINECATEADDCADQAQCTNTVGGYECACNDGYEGDGVVCNDIDECTTNADTCPETSTCINTEGSFRCTCDHIEIRSIPPNSGWRTVTDSNNSDGDFTQADDMVVSPDGTITITDSLANTIQSLEPNGTWNVLADNFSNPTDMLLAPNGTLYVITGGPNVYTLRALDVGGDWRNVRGPDGEDPTFALPTKIALAPDGTLYIADGLVNIIKVLRPGESWQTLTDANNSSGFGSIEDILVAPNGTLYASDFNRNSGVAVLEPGGVWQSLTDSNNSRGGLRNAAAMLLAPDGTLYVVDQGADTIKVLEPGGAWRTLTDIHNSTGNLENPDQMALAPNGTLYVSNSRHSAVKVLEPGKPWRTLNDYTDTTSIFNNPGPLALDNDGTLYVLDTGLDQIRATRPELEVPLSRGVATYNATLYVADMLTESILFRDSDGTWKHLLDGLGSTGDLGRVNALAVSPNGILHTSSFDSVIHTLDLRDPNAVWTILTDSADNTGNFVYPAGFAFDATGTLYVSDRRSGSNDVIKTLPPASQPQRRWQTLTDFTGSEGPFSDPWALALDTNNTLYVADANNATVHTLAPNANGNLVWGDVLDANGSSGNLVSVVGIAVSSNQTLFAATGEGIHVLQPGGVWEVLGEHTGVQFISLSQDETTLFLSQNDGSLQRIDLTDETCALP